MSMGATLGRRSDSCHYLSGGAYTSSYLGKDFTFLIHALPQAELTFKRGEALGSKDNFKQQIPELKTNPPPCLPNQII